MTIPLALLTPPPDTLPTVVACPARDLPRQSLVDWGEALAEVADETGKRVALIASADQGHGHAADGPYGYTAVSAEYDAAMQAAVEANDLPRLLTWPEEYAKTALADSYWQTLAIIGAQKRVPMTAHFLSYEVDHYFGPSLRRVPAERRRIERTPCQSAPILLPCCWPAYVPPDR